ncbi:hypothetical protein O6H91_01G057700 [Diphasiastrum complanatum]|uniref:Uncharacterized protein n=1 Tax=Diphasiastrum complanatum TaxID=34168 RepID=A0ACC2ER99_DIPCM|nr:hypothetical protein O6H91_01G057700 [Diphasiastrum complanatum]
MYLYPFDGPSRITFVERQAWDCLVDGSNCFDAPYNSLPSVLTVDFNMYLYLFDGLSRITFVERQAWDCLVDGLNCSDALSLCSSPTTILGTMDQIPPSPLLFSFLHIC